MDANRQRFFLLADPSDWGPDGEDSRIEYDTACRRLRLRDRRPRRLPEGAVINGAPLESLLTAPSRAIDAFDTVASWDPAAGALRASGGAGSPFDSILLWSAPPNTRAADLALGHDDVLYLALHQLDNTNNIASTALGLFDPRGRWRQPAVVNVPLENFTPDLLAPDPRGGVWVVDRAQQQLGRLQGLPLRDGLPPRFAETTFRPDPENPRPPRFRLALHQPPFVPGAERPIAMACSPAGRLAIVTWRDPDNAAWLHLAQPEGTWLPPRLLEDADHPVSIAWLSASRLVLLTAPRLVAGQTVQPREALAYDPDDTGNRLVPTGGFLPLRDAAEPRFLNGPVLPPRYTARNGGPTRLVPLSVRAFEPRGQARGRVIDAAQNQAVWHRLYLETVLPHRSGIIVDLAASDDPAFQPAEADWEPHLFGQIPPDAAPWSEGPRWALPAQAAWLPDRSEIPHHPGLLGTPPDRDRAGLFTTLVQRPGRAVRRLTGRYLHSRFRVFGTGSTSPEIAAFRAYASRFSYRDEYLPEVYREERFGADADQIEPCSGPDFLERFLGLFESVLTPLEDRVALAQILFDPRSAPDDALDWLGSWIGVLFDPGFPVDRRRAWIEAAPRLFRTRGTLPGLQLALEIASGGQLESRWVRDRQSQVPTGGQVTGGEILVIEDFRLRRTFSTLLGTNFSVADDPLLPGLIVSANSRVGDTLFIGELRPDNATSERLLGEVESTELLALFRDLLTPDESQRLAEAESVRAFYGRLAHRVTVFVHQTVSPVDLAWIERIARREAPAHVVLRVVTASYPLLVGLASLVDVDTYLGPQPPRLAVELERTRIGEGDFIPAQGTLDPRLGGLPAPVFERPAARIAGPANVAENAAFVLDGAASAPAPGRTLDRYVWTLVNSII